MTDAGGMQAFAFGLPMVERSRDDNGVGCRMREFKANGHQWWAGTEGIVMILVVFHNCEFDGFLWRNSFTEHFCYEEDDNGSEKASASEEIDQGVTSRSQHGCHYYCDHKSMNR